MENFHQSYLLYVQCIYYKFVFSFITIYPQLTVYNDIGIRWGIHCIIFLSFSWMFLKTWHYLNIFLNQTGNF